MKIHDSAFVRISWGMLITIGTGLVLFTGYLVGSNGNVSAQDKRIDAHEQRINTLEAENKKYVEAIHRIDVNLGIIATRVENLTN